MSRVFFLVLAGLTLASCSKVRDLIVSGADPAQLEIAVKEGGQGKLKRVCVDRVLVWATHGDQGNRLLWEIASSGEDCVWLGRLIYGETPPGFVMVRPATPLEPRVTYEVFAKGWTRALPNVPWSVGARVMFDQGSWNVMS